MQESWTDLLSEIDFVTWLSSGFGIRGEPGGTAEMRSQWFAFEGGREGEGGREEESSGEFHESQMRNEMTLNSRTFARITTERTL